MNLVPQFGFFELLLIGVIALIVVGPKDLPKLMRSAGQFVAKARRMAGEFAAAFDQMARETEMEELRQEIETLKKENVFTKTKREIDESLSPAEKAVRDEAADIEDAVNRPHEKPAPQAEPENSSEPSPENGAKPS